MVAAPFFITVVSSTLGASGARHQQERQAVVDQSPVLGDGVAAVGRRTAAPLP